MDRLQKLYDAGISFQIDYDPGLNTEMFWLIREYNKHGHRNRDIYGRCEKMAEAVDGIWQAAKRAYPDAECFKEEVDVRS